MHANYLLDYLAYISYLTYKITFYIKWNYIYIYTDSCIFSDVQNIVVFNQRNVCVLQEFYKIIILTS